MPKIEERRALIVGASSGIGEALARELHKAGWTLGLLARRIEMLRLIATDLGVRVLVGYCDVSSDDAVDRFNEMASALSGVDLVIISAGCGILNPTLEIGPDRDTVAVNVSGFMKIALAAFRQFEERGQGHLAAITSVAALRSNADGNAYAASKAFQSLYLGGLRESAQRKRLAITVTELQPGFVDTAMGTASNELPPVLRRLLVADATTAARQMIRAISRRKKHAYITRRYAWIALLFKLLPRPGK
jgi:short-subunit dehydrogenase